MDWKTKLAEFIEARKRDPFVWGVSDCCLFSADAVKEIAGFDFAAWFRGKYDTEKRAHELLKEFAGAGLRKTIVKLARKHSMKRIDKRLAQNSDLALIDTQNGDALAIVWNGKAVSQGENELLFLPISAIKIVWRYGKK